MGQKVNPIGLRLGVNRTWDSRWYANSKDFARLLHEDIKIRKFVREKLKAAGISKIIIERPLKKCRVTVHTAKPGVVIGKKGAEIEKLRKDLARMAPGAEVHLNLVEVRKPETDATLVAEGVAQQLERRVAFRRAMKRAMQSAMRLGAQGIRINVSGRLGGAEIARMEWYREGRVPLHTLRADVDYGFSEADTAYGKIGVKTWIFKGEIMEHDPMAQDKRSLEAGENRERRDRDDRGPRGPRDDVPRRGRRPALGDLVFGVDGEVVDTRSSPGRSGGVIARGEMPGDRQRSGQAATPLARAPGEETDERTPSGLVNQIARVFDTGRFERLLNGLLELVTRPTTEPDTNLTAELKWLGDQLRNGVVSVDSSIRNQAKAVALNVASLIDDPSPKRQRAAIQYLIEFANIVAPPKTKARSDSLALEYALNHFGICYFLNATLSIDSGASSGVYRIMLRDHLSGLIGVDGTIKLRGLRKNARVEAFISTGPGHSERRDLSGPLPIDLNLPVSDIADAPYPALTLVIDGEVALQHRRAPADVQELEGAWA